MNTALTIADLKSFVRSQSRRNSADYVGAVSAWHDDSNTMQSQRRRVKRHYGARWKNDSAQLVPGKYGRLTITETSIDYCVGQYAPTEIWGAVYAYLQATN